MFGQDAPHGPLALPLLVVAIACGRIGYEAVGSQTSQAGAAATGPQTGDAFPAPAAAGGDPAAGGAASSDRGGWQLTGASAGVVSDSRLLAGASGTVNRTPAAGQGGATSTQAPGGSGGVEPTTATGASSLPGGASGTANRTPAAGQGGATSTQAPGGSGGVEPTTATGASGFAGAAGYGGLVGGAESGGVRADAGAAGSTARAGTAGTTDATGATGTDGGAASGGQAGCGGIAATAGAAGTSGAAGGGAAPACEPLAPLLRSFTFDTDAINWEAYTEVPNACSVAWLSTTGHDAPGALQATMSLVDVDAFTSMQYRDVPLTDMNDRIVVAHVLVQSGSDLAGKLYVQTTDYAWADSGSIPLELGVWTCLSLDIAHPAYQNAGYDPNNVLTIGVRVRGVGDATVLLDDVVY